jgi:elongation factor 1-alpha
MKYFSVIHRKAKPLKKEKDDGYIEYKWKLVDIQKTKFIKITTQMKYRLQEGDGKSIYAIGFDDNGNSLGISYKELQSTLLNLVYVINELNADIYKIMVFIDDNNLYCAKLFINKELNDDFF